MKKEEGRGVVVTKLLISTWRPFQVNASYTVYSMEEASIKTSKVALFEMQCFADLWEWVYSSRHNHSHT